MASRSTRRTLCTAALALTAFFLALVVVLADGLEDLSARAIGNGSIAEARTIDASAGQRTGAITPVHPLLSGLPGNQSPLLSGLINLPPATATIEPSAGVTTTISIPGSRGTVNVPNDATGDVPVTVDVRHVALPTNAPAGLTVLSAIQISFTSLVDSSSVNNLSQDVTIEISYAGLGLASDQLDSLVIYNATRNEFLPTTIDTSRQVAIAQTRRFSTFSLARITGPIPRSYMPLASREFPGAW